MTKGRLEAFSDGVIAIIITIMVLELKKPDGATWAALAPVVPHLLGYLLSFVFVGIYWNNHHHLLHSAERIDGRTLWANLHLLFWLSLVPWVTAWSSEEPFSPVPTALYGVVLLCDGLSYLVLQISLIRAQGPGSRLQRAVGRDLKGKASVALYALAIPLALLGLAWAADALYVVVALVWLVPDRRLEKTTHPG